MANLTQALQELRQERSRAQWEVEKIDEAISALEGLGGRNFRMGTHAGRTSRLGRPRRRVSAAGRRRIAAAQRARWAKLKAKQQARETKKAKRGMSAAVRRRVARAQRIRWAKLRAEKKAAARVAKKPVQKAQANAA